MSDYRNNIGKKKQRQTGISIDASSWGDSGGSSSSGSSSSDDSSTTDSLDWNIDTDTSSDSGGSSSDSGSGGSSSDSSTNVVTDTFETVSDTVDEATSTAQETIDDTAGDQIDETQDTVSSIQDTVDDAISSVTGGDSGSETTSEETQDAADRGAFGGDQTTDTSNDSDSTTDGSSTEDAGGLASGEIRQVTPDVGNLLPDVDAPDAEEVVDKASGEVEDTVESTQQTVDDALTGAEETVDDAVSGAEDVVDEATGGAEDAVSDATDFASGLASGAEDLASGGGDVVDAVADTIPLDPTGGVAPLAEGIARQFDNKKGGGIADILGDTATDIQDEITNVAGGSGTTETTTDESGSGPTEVKWSPIEQVTAVKGAIIFKQEATNTQDSRVRYFAIGQAKDGSEVAYGRGDKAVKVDSVDSISDLPHFSTVSAAKNAVPHRQKRATDRRKDKSKPRWKNPKKVNQIGAVAIMEQRGNVPSGGTKFRYYAITKSDNGTIILLRSADRVVRLPEIDGFDEAPHFSNQGAAEEAAQGYMERVSADSGQASTNVVGGPSGAEGQPSITTTDGSPRVRGPSSSGLGAAIPSGLSPTTLGLGALVVGGGIYAATRGDDGGPVRVVRANLGQTGR